MKNTLKLAAIAVAAVGGFAGVATSASAAIVCNAQHVCWHTRAHYAYKPEFNVVVHPNKWRWAHNEHYEWKEHHGRGYWRDGAWVRF